MHKQVISFSQVIKFLENMDLKGGVNPNPNPPLRTPLRICINGTYKSMVCIMNRNKYSIVGKIRDKC